MINVIIIIGKNIEVKQKFINKLNEKMKFSYTKLEAIFETFLDLYPEKFSKENKENFSKFLVKFLENLKDKKEISVLDINELSVKNSELLMENNSNIMVIYLEKIEGVNKCISIDGENELQVNSLIEKIKNL